MIQRTVSPKELTHYRLHFRQAVKKEYVLCLECGALFKSLPQHVRKHGLTVEAYRENWGYNRTSRLVSESTHRARRRVALALNLALLSPPNALRKALKARRGSGSPHRPESRLQQKEAGQARRKQEWRPSKLRRKDQALKALVRQGYAPEEISLRTKLSYRHVRKRLRALRLDSALVRRFKPSQKDLKILSLRRSGFWASQIARRVAMNVRSVNKRLKRLRENGSEVPPPVGPRPNPWRKVSDEKLLTLRRLGLSPVEIAAKVRIARKNVYWRLKRLKGRQETLSGPERQS
jgi:transposase